MSRLYNWKRNQKIYDKVRAKKLTLREIAAAEGMSHTNVRRIAKSHARKLRKAKSSKAI